jgi:putative ABC transport system permease protein
LKIVGPGYFHVLGLRVRRGRVLGEDDRETAGLVAVINDTMARTFFPASDPIGQRLLMDAPGLGDFNKTQTAFYEVVGVIADERLTPFDDGRDHAVMYVSSEQDPRDFVGVIVGTSLDAARAEATVRAAVAGVDRDVAVTRVRTMDQWLSESMSPDRFRSTLLGMIAALALALSAIGVYGVIAYSVAQRAHELAIRAALGASPAHLMQLVVGQGVTLAASGLAVGALGAVGLTRLLGSFLFGVGASDVVTWASSTIVLATVAIAASLIPAWAAARVDPVGALRAD